MGRKLVAALGGTAVALAGAGAVAHVDVASGPGFAGKSQEITLAVGHGCEGKDTASVRVQIPEGVASVRAVPGGLGKATVETDATGLVTAVTWQKDDADLAPADLHYYKVALRIRVPDRPFTTLFFPTRQTCKADDGTPIVVDWVSTLPSEGEEGPEPAPALKILPVRQPGWNKYTVPVAIDDLGAWFGDAQIVWRGNAAFSANPLTAEQIAGTPGVTALASLAANDEIWVRY